LSQDISKHVACDSLSFSRVTRTKY
jgi:hypothetical protein